MLRPKRMLFRKVELPVAGSCERSPYALRLHSAAAWFFLFRATFTFGLELVCSAVRI